MLACLLVFTLISAGKHSWQHFPKFNNEILRKGVESFQSYQWRRTPMLLNVSMSMRLFWWIELYLNLLQLFLSIIYLIWYIVRYTMRSICTPPNVIKSTKLPGAQHSPELAFRSTDFHVPKNIIFPALNFIVLLLLLCDILGNMWIVIVW